MEDEKSIEELREEKRDQLEDQEQEIEDQKKQVRQQASQYLSKDAKSRLGNIRAADPEKASAVEMQIARLGEMGQIEEISDEQLKDILRSIGEEEGKSESDIKFRR
jgi:programmed cell death protein 5